MATDEGPEQRADAEAEAVPEAAQLDRASVPVDVRNVSFRTAVRGYERRAVDAYVQQVNRLIAELEISRSPRSAVRAALDRVAPQVDEILQSARETGEEVIRNAIEEADAITAAARDEADAVRVDAEQRLRAAESDIEAIERRRREIVAEIEQLGERLRTLASEHAS